MQRVKRSKRKQGKSPAQSKTVGHTKHLSVELLLVSDLHCIGSRRRRIGEPRKGGGQAKV